MKNVLKYLIEQSLDCLYANDKDLLERKVAERDITHRFAHYFENNIAGTIVAALSFSIKKVLIYNG